MNQLLEFRTSNENLDAEFEIITPVDLTQPMDVNRKNIINDLNAVESRMAANQKILNELNVKIDKLTNHADGIDNIIAIGSGVLTGLIDSFFVNEFSLLEEKKWGSDKVNEFVTNFANKNGYKGHNERNLENAISFLEKKFGLASDSLTNEFGGGTQHHLRDFAHHPTPLGLLFSFLTQFSQKAYGTNTAGSFIVLDITNQSLIGKTLPEKFTFGIINWFGHMISDMAGSSNTVRMGKMGTGLPGPLGSLLKELSALLNPICPKNKDANNEFSVWVSKLFNGTLLGERDENGKIIKALGFDLRAEIGVLHYMTKQFMPVIFNECIVRGFYFIRRFIMELKQNHVSSFTDLKKINWKNTIPTGNRTIIRMLTIASGTFMAIDMADAAIRSGLKSGGEPTAYLTNFILHVNFVGIGRFALAVGQDSYMGHNRNKIRNERMELYSQLLFLYSTKVYYKQADMWTAAKNTTITIEQICTAANTTMIFSQESLHEIFDKMEAISSHLPGIDYHNPDLLSEMSNVLKY